jgi:ABC-2 type transport system permease protein
VGQVVILVPTALALGWSPDGNLALVVPAYVLGTAAFAGIGLLMAGTLRGTITLAAANGLYIVLLLLGGMIIPLTSLHGLRYLADLLPAAPLSQVMAAAFNSAVHVSTGNWIVLLVWAVAAPLAAARYFRWE